MVNSWQLCFSVWFQRSVATQVDDQPLGHRRCKNISCPDQVAFSRKYLTGSVLVLDDETKKQILTQIVPQLLKD